jgi:hypothetical protein
MVPIGDTVLVGALDRSNIGAKEGMGKMTKMEVETNLMADSKSVSIVYKLWIKPPIN